MDKIAAYIRITDPSNNAEIDSQKLKFETWASKKGLQIYDFYIDRNINILTPVNERQGFNRILKDIKVQGITTILTLGFDMITKNKFEFVNLLHKLRLKNVKIIEAI